MHLHRIAVENYRCFRDSQQLTLSPVTVVFGRNNSGKSALVRAPVLVSTGFDTTSTSALDLDRVQELGLDDVADFGDLVFGGNTLRPLGIDVDIVGERAFKMSTTLQYINEIRRVAVSEMVIAYGRESVELQLVPQLILAGGHLPYRVTVDHGISSVHDVEFHGLVPEFNRHHLPAWMKREWTIGPIRYMSSYREPPSRYHHMPFSEPKTLDANGRNAAAILAYDRAYARGVLLDIVNRHLGDIVPGWEIDEEKDGPIWQTVLRRHADPSTKVNLIDGGTGIAQVLPLLVQCALDERAGSKATATLQIVEEPEMHLHPAAHAGLADVYLRTASATGTRFLIETHSETLLLRLRRRIAEGVYSPEMVGIYVVEQDAGVSTVRRVGLDARGNLSDEWPEGYFSQDYHEVRALAAAQLEHSA